MNRKIFLAALCGVSFCVSAFVRSGRAAECPPCYKNQPPMPGHGAAPDGSDKRLIRVQIKAGAGPDSWSDQPDGGTNPQIWNGLNGCGGCTQDGAAQMWKARATKYYFSVNQSNNNPDIIIVKGGVPAGDCAATEMPGPPYIIHLRAEEVNDSPSVIASRIAHEIGHTIGLSDTTPAACGNSIMNTSLTDSSGTNCALRINTSIFSKDVQSSNQNANNRTFCSSQNPGFPTADGGDGGCPDSDADGWSDCGGDCEPNNREIHPGVIVRDYYYNGCPITPPANTDVNCNAVDDYWECSPSPILIDVAGNGFSLTNAAGGVDFDMRVEGALKRIAWTAKTSDDAWLALDRNANGTIDNGAELFGNFTPQTRSYGVIPNGFVALAEYDKPPNGGNGDGQIDSRDAIFSLLLIWQDNNHNGVSETSELHTLSNLGIASMDLSYVESKRTDQYGNLFRCLARIKDSHFSRWAYDVFLVHQ